MKATEAREYLNNAANTATGRRALWTLGHVQVIKDVSKIDDASAVRIAKELVKELRRLYRF